MRLHVGEQDLVDDDQSDQHADHRAHGEYVADGRAAAPVVDLALHVLVGRQQQDIVRDGLPNGLLHRRPVGPGVQPDQPELDQPRVAVGDYALKVEIRGDDRTVDAERSAQLEQTHDGDMSVVELQFNGAIRRHGGDGRRELGPRETVHQHPVGLAQYREHFADAWHPDAGVTGIDADRQNIAVGCRRVFEVIPRERDIDRRHRFDFLESEHLIQAVAWKALGRGEIRGPRAQHDEVLVHRAVQPYRAVEQR